jgi:hypothetical protein
MPACFRMLFSVPGGNVSLNLPAIVVVPGLTTCRNWRWLPVTRSRYQPSASTILIISLTLGGTAPTPIRPDKNETNGSSDHRQFPFVAPHCELLPGCGQIVRVGQPSSLASPDGTAVGTQADHGEQLRKHHPVSVTCDGYQLRPRAIRWSRARSTKPRSCCSGLAEAEGIKPSVAVSSERSRPASTGHRDAVRTAVLRQSRSVWLV